MASSVATIEAFITSATQSKATLGLEMDKFFHSIPSQHTDEYRQHLLYIQFQKLVSMFMAIGALIIQMRKKSKFTKDLTIGVAIPEWPEIPFDDLDANQWSNAHVGDWGD